MAFEQLSKESVLENKWYSVFKEEYTLPNSKTGVYYAIRGLVTVFIIPMLSADTALLTKQFRYLTQQDSWEFPAGKVDDGETPEQGALRELEEETGYKSTTLDKVGVFYPCNGLSDEVCHVYIARDLQKTQQELDDTEQLTVHEKSVDEINEMIDNNTVRDGMSITAWRMSESIRK